MEEDDGRSLSLIEVGDALIEDRDSLDRESSEGVEPRRQGRSRRASSQHERQAYERGEEPGA